MAVCHLRELVGERMRHLWGRTSGLLLLIALSRLPAFCIPFWNKDEAWNAARALATTAGGRFYIDAYDHKTPLLYYIYDWCFRLVDWPWQMTAVRVWYLLSVVGTAWGIAWMARYFGGERAGRDALRLFAVFSLAWIAQETYYAGTEIFMNLPLTLAAVCLLQGDGARFASGWRLAGWTTGAGALVGIGVLMRNSALTAGLACLAYLGWRVWRTGAWRREWARAGWGLAGAAVPLLICWRYLVAVGAWDEAYFWNVTFVKLFLAASPTWREVLWVGIVHTAMVVGSMLLLYVLAGLGSRRVWGALRERPEGLFLLLWLASGMAAILPGGRFSTHYYFQLLPVLAVLAGLQLAATRDWWRAAVWRRRLLWVACVAPLLGFSGEYIRHVARHYGWWQDPPAARVISEAVRRYTTPADRIVVWGYLPHVYYFSRRLPATRFHTMTHLTGQIREDHEYALDTPQLKKLWRDFDADLARYQPALFVDASRSQAVSGRYIHPVERFPHLHAWLDQHYERVAEVRGAIFYARKEPYDPAGHERR